MKYLVKLGLVTLVASFHNFYGYAMESNESLQDAKTGGETSIALVSAYSEDDVNESGWEGLLSLPRELNFNILIFLDKDSLLNMRLVSIPMKHLSDCILKGQYVDFTDIYLEREDDVRIVIGGYEKVNLCHNNLSGQRLVQALRGLVHVKGLDLSSNYTEDEGLVPVSSLRNLQYLGLRGNHLRGTTLSQLSSLPQLKVLGLSANYIAEDKWRSLTMPTLRALDMSYNHSTQDVTVPISGATIKHLAMAMKNLRVLWLEGNMMTREAIENISFFADLECLNIYGCGVQVDWLVPLKGLSKLTKLAIEEETLKAAGLTHWKDTTDMVESGGILYYCERERMFE